MTRERLVASALPLLERLSQLQPSDPADCERVLAEVDTAAFEVALREAHAEGWVTPKQAGTVKYGRLARAGVETLGFSIDIVEMAGSAPGAHTHPTGEFDLNLPLSGTPRFDGRADRWVVYPPNSRHVPTVSGGTMLIAYFLPEGAIRHEGG